MLKYVSKVMIEQTLGSENSCQEWGSASSVAISCPAGCPCFLKVSIWMYMEPVVQPQALVSEWRSGCLPAMQPLSRAVSSRRGCDQCTTGIHGKDRQSRVDMTLYILNDNTSQSTMVFKRGRGLVDSSICQSRCPTFASLQGNAVPSWILHHVRAWAAPRLCRHMGPVHSSAEVWKLAGNERDLLCIQDIAFGVVKVDDCVHMWIYLYIFIFIFIFIFICTCFYIY